MILIPVVVVILNDKVLLAFRVLCNLPVTTCPKSMDDTILHGKPFGNRQHCMLIITMALIFIATA